MRLRWRRVKRWNDLGTPFDQATGIVFGTVGKRAFDDVTGSTSANSFRFLPLYVFDVSQTEEFEEKGVPAAGGPVGDVDGGAYTQFSGQHPPRRD